MYLPSRQSKKSTGVRLNTALRAPTGYSQNIQVSTMNSPFLNISERPITQQGIAGLKSSAGGPKRKVLSRSYFLTLMKQRIADLTNEVASFRNQKEAIEKELEETKSNEKTFESLSSEVRLLEDTLSDNNVAFDKQRTGVRSDDLLGIAQHISLQNQRLRNQLDMVFMERREYEDKSSSIESQIQNIIQSAELRLNELSKEDQEEYKTLQRSIEEVGSQFEKRNQHLEELNRKISDQESQLKIDTERKRWTNLKENIQRTERKSEQLDEKQLENNLTFEELRTKLLEQVKTEKADIQEIEKRVREVKKLSENVSRRLSKLNDELNGDNEITEEQKKKYEVLYNREKEVNRFLANFENLRSKRLEELSALENGNLRLLETISKHMNLVKYAPSQQTFENLSKEANERKPETIEELNRKTQMEYIQKQEELQRLLSISESLPERIKNLKTSCQSLSQELAGYQDIEGEKASLHKKIEFLQRKIKELQLVSRPDLESESEKAVREYQVLLQKLQAHEQFASFYELEQRLSQTSQMVHGIQTYIRTKESECQFSELVNKILELSSSLNESLIASQ